MLCVNQTIAQRRVLKRPAVSLAWIFPFLR